MPYQVSYSMDGFAVLVVNVYLEFRDGRANVGGYLVRVIDGWLLAL